MLMSSPQNSNLVNEQEKEVTPQFPPSFFCTLINHLFGTCLLPLIAFSISHGSFQNTRGWL